MYLWVWSGLYSLTTPSTIFPANPVFPDWFCLLSECMSSSELALTGAAVFSPPSNRFSCDAFLEGIFLFALSGPGPPSSASVPIDEVLLVLERQVSQVISPAWSQTYLDGSFSLLSLSREGSLPRVVRIFYRQMEDQ